MPVLVLWLPPGQLQQHLMHCSWGLLPPKRHTLSQEHWMLTGEGREGEKGQRRRAQGAVATAARAGLGEKSHSTAAHTMKVRARETELEVLVGTVVDPEVCYPHSRCCGR